MLRDTGATLKAYLVLRNPRIKHSTTALMNNAPNNPPAFFNIAPLLPPLPRLKIVDVGAMSLGEGTDAYSLLASATPCDVYGFEPGAEEFEKLKASAKPGHHYLPHFIGDGSAQTFYECNFTMTSSLLEPNTALLAQFQNLEELTRVRKTYPVETRRLDDIPELEGTDFLKIDAQGAELMIFEGAARILDGAQVIHTEVQFVPLYKGVPLFGEIDVYLRSKGFSLHRLTQAGRTFKPMIFMNDVNATLSQILWGDAIYVRDFMLFDRLPGLDLLKIATILHENYRSVDLAAVALACYDRGHGTTLQQTYLKKLGVV
jgi:FkbM family methyltransferase